MNVPKFADGDNRCKDGRKENRYYIVREGMSNLGTRV